MAKLVPKEALPEPALPDPMGDAAAAEATARQGFAVPVTRELTFQRAPSGNVVVVLTDPVSGVILSAIPVLPDEFAAAVEKLGDLGPATKTPGADHTIRAVASE